MADIPRINVIIIEQDPEDYVEVIIDSYMDLLENATTYEQKRIALTMLVDELSLYLAQDLIKRQISKHCEVLQELKDEQFNKR